MNRDKSDFHGHCDEVHSKVVTPSDSQLIQLIGGYSYESVTLTSDQMTRLGRFYNIDLRKSTGSIEKTGDMLAIFRRASLDGLRMIAFLSKFHMDEDPVKILYKLCEEAGFDVSYADHEWAHTDEVDDE